jgi:hypothetical protein
LPVLFEFQHAPHNPTVTVPASLVIVPLKKRRFFKFSQRTNLTNHIGKTLAMMYKRQVIVKIAQTPNNNRRFSKAIDRQRELLNEMNLEELLFLPLFF